MHASGGLEAVVADGDGLLLEEVPELVLLDALLPDPPQQIKPLIQGHRRHAPGQTLGGRGSSGGGGRGCAGGSLGCRRGVHGSSGGGGAAKDSTRSWRETARRRWGGGGGRVCVREEENEMAASGCRGGGRPGFCWGLGRVIDKRGPLSSWAVVGHVYAYVSGGGQRFQ